MEPRIIYKPAFTVVGFAQAVDGGGGDHESLWEQLAARFREIPFANPDVGYGVHITRERTHSYLVGLGVTQAGGPVPAGMSHFAMGPQTHAVFAHSGWMVGLPQTVTAIYDTWLPKVGYRPAEDYYFEFYDDHFQPNSALSTIFIWVPVVPSGPAEIEKA